MDINGQLQMILIVVTQKAGRWQEVKMEQRGKLSRLYQIIQLQRVEIHGTPPTGHIRILQSSII